MKKLLFAFVVALAAMATVGCEKTEEKTPDAPKTVPEISVLTGTIQPIPDAGGSIEVAFKSNLAWTLSIPAEADWLSADSTSGEAGEEITVTLTAEANDKYDKRTAVVTISCGSGNDAASAEIPVSQKQKGALILTDDVVEVGYEGGPITIVLNANSEVSFAVAEDAVEWIVPAMPDNAPTRALVESKYYFNVLPNDVKEERQGVITFTNQAGSETVTVKQEALPEPAPELTLDPASISGVSVEGGSQVLTLKSNMPWTVALEDGVEWIAVNPASGEAGENQQVTVNIQENKANDGRITSLTFTCTNAKEESMVVTVKVSQEGLNVPHDIHIENAADLVQFASDYNSGYYASVLDSLTVTLDSDITFDAESSAEFNATGGIGTKDGDNTNYFHGVFNGGMHAIKGLSATVPVFAYVGSEGTVKKLVVDATSSFVFTHSGAADSNFGAVAGYHKGVLDTVSVSADVTLAAAENVAFETCLGGIVGRETVGSVKNSAYSGKIKVKSDFSSADAKIMIGGIVGRISNADGKVQDSAFSGLIDNEGKMIASSETDALKSNPYLMIGGIAGLNSGTIDKCNVANHATGITVTLTDDSDHDYTGTVVTHSTNAYHYAIAGIAGRNDGTVSACTNNATVLNAFYGERGTSGNMNGRYLNVGGLVGFNGSDATVSGSTNNGPIIDRAIPKMHYVAGIVGRNKGKVSSCTNTSDGSISVGTAHITPYGARMLYLGGVAGYSEKGSAVDDISNAGEITVSRYENTTGIIVAIGGVVGKSDVDVDGSTGTIANSGAITQSNGCGLCAEPTSDNDYGLFLGGVVGYATASVKNVSNSGALSYTCSASGKGARYVHLGGVAGKVNAASTVDIEHCTNTANVTYVAKAKYSDNNATRYYHNYVGGIVGYANNAAIKGDSSSKCTNTGIVKAGDGSANNNNNGDDVVPSFVVGGIVGHITGASSIEYCELAGTGQSYNDHFSNRVIDKYDCPSNGGIAGQVVGADGTPISISHCAVSSTAGTAGNTAVYSRRGATGGIVGIAEYANVSDCSVPVDYTGSGYYYGGIAGLIKNGTISSCNYTGTKIQSSQIKLGGGIVGKLDAAGIVDACTSSATTIDKNGTAITDFGGIAGVSVPGSTIKNSHCKSGMSICSDANFTDGGGNAADL